MATAVVPADVLIFKNTQILVNVDEALSDMLVVTYFNENRRFQGVLLDSTKRNLPFGVSSLHPAFLASQKCANGNDDKLYSTSQRFAYQDPDYTSKPLTKPKQQQQRSKMTVRLRPRKVLCSNCRGICNENSENVAESGKRKVSGQNATTKEKKVYLSADSTSRNIDDEESRTLIMGHSLIPKISRLHPNEITNALNGNIYNRNEIWLRQSDDKSDPNFVDEFGKKIADVSSESNTECPIDNFNKSDILYSSSEGNSESRFVRDNGDDNSESNHRKRKIKISFKNEVSSSNKKKRAETFIVPDAEESSSSVFSNPRTLKISYGEGEGTVLKLPVMVGEFGLQPEGQDTMLKVDTKAAKRALKRAKKQAKRQTTPSTSPLHDPDFEIFQRKHKHKVKLNKKKKNTYKESERLQSVESRATDPLATDPLATNIIATPLSPPPIDVIS